MTTLTNIEEALQRVWGFSSFRPLQREAIQAILGGRDSVVVLPTGGGKSLCFQAPALILPSVVSGFSRTEGAGPPEGPPKGPPKGGHHLERSGFALVVSPLISLMKDQVDGLRVDG